MPARCLQLNIFIKVSDIFLIWDWFRPFLSSQYFKDTPLYNLQNKSVIRYKLYTELQIVVQYWQFCPGVLMWPEIIYVTPRCSVTRCSNNINGIAREAGNILTPVRCLVLVREQLIDKSLDKYFSSDSNIFLRFIRDLAGRQVVAPDSEHCTARRIMCDNWDRDGAKSIGQYIIHKHHLLMQRFGQKVQLPMLIESYWWYVKFKIFIV